MIRKTTAAFLVAAAAAVGSVTLTTVNLWNSEKTSPIQQFGTYGSDTAPARNPQWFLNAQGQPFMTFDSPSGGRARWQRFDEPQRKRRGVPAQVHINGEGTFTFHADSTITGQYYSGEGIEAAAQSSGLRVWLTPPVGFALSVQDSLWGLSGPIYFNMDDCTYDPTRPCALYVPPGLPEARYHVQIVKGGEVRVDDYATSTLSNRYSLPQGDYDIWFSLVDSLGMEGHWIGPVNLIAGECP